MYNNERLIIIIIGKYAFSCHPSDGAFNIFFLFSFAYSGADNHRVFCTAIIMQGFTAVKYIHKPIKYVLKVFCMSIGIIQLFSLTPFIQ